jgi:hypothetical protein
MLMPHQLPGAPSHSRDGYDWWLYHDILADDPRLQPDWLLWVGRIALSLDHHAALLPVVVYGAREGCICIPWEAWVSSTPYPHRVHFPAGIWWLDPHHVPEAARPFDFFTHMGSPWRLLPEDDYSQALNARAGGQAGWLVFRDAYLDALALAVPPKGFRLSPLMDPVELGAALDGEGDPTADGWRWQP